MATKTASVRDRLAERGLVRLHLDVPVDAANDLEVLEQATGYNKTTTVVRAIRILRALEQIVRGGGTITVTHSNGDKERLLLS